MYKSKAQILIPMSVEQFLNYKPKSMEFKHPNLTSA